MKKIPSGNTGYLDYKKKVLLIQVLISFGIVAAIFICGLIIFHTRKNAVTIVAIVGVLPAARCLVNYIVAAPHKSLAVNDAKEIRECAGELPVLYDYVFTAKEGSYPVAAFALSENTMCGLYSGKPEDISKAEKHIKSMLKSEGLHKFSVKLFSDKTQYLERVKEMSGNIMPPGETGLSRLRSLFESITL